jgi:hypothetical protein
MIHKKECLSCPDTQDTFVGLAYQGKDIVFRFIIEYSSVQQPLLTGKAL